jgi:hypothetical protein
MKYITVAIQSDYNVYVQEDRFLEFSQHYYIDNNTDSYAKNMYLYNCIMDGWVKRESQA